MSANTDVTRDGLEQKTLRMTTEPVEKLVMKLAVPTIISMLVTAFYNLVDTAFVRQLDNDSMVAAVGVVMPLMALVQAFGFFCGMGSGNYISKAFGKRDYDDAAIMATTAFVDAIAIGLLFLLGGTVFKSALVIALGAKTEATKAYAEAYLTYILLGAPLHLGSIVMNNQLRLQGNAFFAMIGLTTGAVVNIVLDPLLIFKNGDVLLNGALTMPFGAGMGVAGAALATAISQAISFFILLFGLFRSDNVKFNLKKYSFRGYYLKHICKNGLPSIARQGLASVATACLNHSVGMYLVEGAMIDAAQAAVTGVSKIMIFFASAMIGFGQGFQPVCGFNFGAKKYDRVLKAFKFCVFVATGALFVISVLGIIFAEPLTSIVAGTSETTLKIGVETFRYQIVVLPLLAWTTMCNMLLQNIGYTGRATFVAMARQGITFAPSVLLLPMIVQWFGAEPLLGIEIAQMVADILAFFISMPIGIGVLRSFRKMDQEMALNS